MNSVQQLEIRNDKGQFVKPLPQSTNKNGTAGRPTAIDDMILRELRTAFLMGYSDKEACVFAGIGESTLYDYQKSHPEFSEEKKAWKTNPVLKAKSTIYNALGTDVRVAMWYLERRAKKEFSLRREVVSSSSEPVVVEYVLPEEKKEQECLD